MPLLNIDGNRVFIDRTNDKDLSLKNTSTATKALKDDDGVAHIKTEGEVKQIIADMNKDEIETDNNMSSIDMRTRLSSIEASAMTAWDSLVQMSFMPIKSMSITRQKKRLNVSLAGEGRKESVQLTQNNNELKSGAGVMQKIGNAFGLGGQK